MTVFNSILTFFTGYASPFTETLAGVNRLPAGAEQSLPFQELGVASFLLQAAILMGVILFALRRWSVVVDPPVGRLDLYGGRSWAVGQLSRLAPAGAGLKEG